MISLLWISVVTHYNIRHNYQQKYLSIDLSNRLIKSSYLPITNENLSISKRLVGKFCKPIIIVGKLT